MVLKGGGAIAGAVGIAKMVGLGLLVGAMVQGISGISHAQAAPPVSCPFNIPVVTLPPHQAGGFNWGPVIRPMYDPCLGSIAVDPTSDLVWYVGGLNGLYMTKDGGHTWTHPLNGSISVVALIPGKPQLIYVGVANKLYLSRDRGSHWTVIGTFKHSIGSVMVAHNRLYVGLRWSTHAAPSGVFVSNLGGGLSKFHPFGPGHTGLIVWTLARDPQDGTLYAGAEIFDHPQPYHPPFFRSTDGGVTWTNVAGTLPWHVIAATVRPNDGFVYALTEGAGLFGSPDKGATWQAPATSTGLGDSLLMDPNNTKRLFAGRQKFGTLSGGIFFSIDGGKVFQPIGLIGVTIGGLALNGKSTRIFAAAYASGIYTSPIPAGVQQ